MRKQSSGARSNGLLSPQTFASLMHWSGELLDLVFPPRCIGCGRVDNKWCDDCHLELDTTPLVLRRKTGYGGRITIVSTGTHDGKLQKAVQALKYYNTPELSHPLAHRLAAGVRQLSIETTHNILITPVPLHPNRQSQRGYNQAQLLTESLSTIMNIPCHTNAVQRHRDTPPQVGLKKQERLQNVKDAFTANPHIVAGQSLLLIDDVCTTGATIAACATAAIKAGANRVTAFTLTVANPQ